MTAPPIDTIELTDGRLVHGFVDAGYGAVIDEFVRNFVERSDQGAGCSVVVEGRVVADLWGGVADTRTGRPQTRDSASVIFSCSKGLLALCVYQLVQEGRVDLDLPVATYWPGFAANGKAHLTVRHALSHRTGLASLDVDLTRADIAAWEPVIRAIEAQRPQFGPDDGFAYHAMTYGWIVGEVIRRVTGLTPGRYLHQRFAEPMGLRTWIGVGDDRVDLTWMLPPLTDDDSAEAERLAELSADGSPVTRSLTMGGAFGFPAAPEGHVSFNDADLRGCEIPGANGVSNASSLARLYAACTVPILGEFPLLERSSIEDALVPRSSGVQLTGIPDDGARWGTGFQLSSPPSQPMLGDRCLGHAGAGGQLAFVDTDRHIAFAYISNQMGGYGDARARSLTRAVEISSATV